MASFHKLVLCTEMANEMANKVSNPIVCRVMDRTLATRVFMLLVLFKFGIAAEANSMDCKLCTQVQCCKTIGVFWLLIFLYSLMKLVYTLC